MTEQLFNANDVKSKSFIVAIKRAIHMDQQCHMTPNTSDHTYTIAKKRTIAGLTLYSQYTIHCVVKEEDGRDACIELAMTAITRKSCELLLSYHCNCDLTTNVKSL